MGPAAPTAAIAKGMRADPLLPWNLSRVDGERIPVEEAITSALTAIANVLREH